MEYDSKKAIEAVTKEYPRGVDLVYIDYRDELDNEQCQEVIRNGYSEILDNADWMADTQWESVSDIIRELAKNEEFEDFEDEMREDDSLREAIYDLDTSDPMKSLLHNTRKKAMFYELDYYVDSTNTEAEAIAQAKAIAKRCKLDYKKWGSELRSLVNEAYYGGNLCIYWYGDVDDLLPVEDPDFKYIRFEWFELCIMDRANGSGYNVTIKETIEIQLKRSNLWLDEEAGGYSYGYDVCGLYMPAFENAPRLGNKLKECKRAIRMVKTKSKLEIAKEKEIQWDKDIKDGKGCNFMDPRYNSHDWEYHNDPMYARSECKHCHRKIMD